MAANPDLAGRYPHHQVLSVEGIRSGGELLAYRVVQPGVLSDDSAVLQVEDGSWVGTGPIVRIASFGDCDPMLHGSDSRRRSPVVGVR